MARRRKRRTKAEKIILFILFVLLAVLLIFAFKDNFTKKEDTNLEEKQNKSSKKDNTKKEEDIKEKIEESKKDNTEPKTSEKSETKQEIQKNITVNIELIGSEEVTINQGEKYNDQGVKATDSNGNDVTKQVSIENNVDTSKKGEYMVIYSIGKSTVIRNVIVK